MCIYSDFYVSNLLFSKASTFHLAWSSIYLFSHCKSDNISGERN